MLDQSLNVLASSSLSFSWSCSPRHYINCGTPTVLESIPILTTAAYIDFAFLSFTFDQYSDWSASGIIFDTDGVLFTEATLPTPAPAALPLFASGLAALGLLARRRKRKTALAA